MGTGSRMPRAQRRTQLLEIATEEFTRRGFQAVAMDDIAHAAGVTKPVLYQHFRSKEALYLAVVEEIRARLLEGAHDLITMPGDSFARAHYGFSRFWELTYPTAGLHLFTSSAQPSEEISRRIGETLDEIALLIATVITRTRRIDADRARVLGRSLLAMAQTTASLLEQTEDPSERDRILETVTHLAVGGLVTFAPLPQPQVHGEVTGADDSPGHDRGPSAEGEVDA